MAESVPQLTGSVVTDAHGQRIGTVTDVLFDDRTQEPRWAVVSYGLLRRHHRVLPVDEMYSADDGRVVATLEKGTVRRAPAIGAHEPLTPEIERAAQDYYGVAG